MQFRNIRSSFWLGFAGRCLISVDVSIPRGTSLVEPVSEGSVWRQGWGCLVELSVLGGDLAARKVGSILSCIWFYMRQLRGRGQALLELFVALGCIRATPLVLSMWPCKLHLDKEKSKHASLARQNGFGPVFLHSLLRLVKGTAKPNTCQRI
jgi:hypothetical protein